MPLYFVIAFCGAWACQTPVYALNLDGPPALALLALGAIAPSLAALVVTRGRVWRDLIRGPRPAWALAAGLLGPTLLVAMAGVATGTLTPGAPFLGSILLPPIGEELGWRGYLQPRLADRHGLLRASLVVGLAWGLWHAPTAIGHWHTFPLFVAVVILDSVLIGWLWHRSNRSLLACICAHAGLNLSLVHASRPAVLTLLVLATSAVVISQAIRRSPTSPSPNSTSR